MAGLRLSPRLASGWYGDRQRSRQQGSRHTVIVGAGSAGDLLLPDAYVYVRAGPYNPPAWCVVKETGPTGGRLTEQAVQRCKVLYPVGSEKKRLIDAMLLAVPR